MGIETFSNIPTAVSVSHVLECAIRAASATPEYIICGRGQQLWCSVFKDCCDRKGIAPRFGAVGQHGISRSMARCLMRSTMICCQRLSVLDSNVGQVGVSQHLHCLITISYGSF